MTKKTSQPTAKVGRKPRPMPELIDDTPENVAKAIVNTPPRKRNQWRFLRRKAKESE